MRIALPTTLMLATFIGASLNRPEIGYAARRAFVQATTLSRAELPTPGQFTLVRAGTKRQFYLASRRSVCDDAADIGKLPGLYSSADGGLTWRNERSDLGFREVFLHPDTGWLFAIIEVEHFRTDFDTDHLERGFRFRVIRSANGRDWSDISGADADFPSAYWIFADPDHEGRVCFRLDGMRPYVVQSADSAYSKWHMLTVGEWRKRHPQVDLGNPSRQPN